MNSEENKKIRKHFRTKRNEEKKEEYSQQQQNKNLDYYDEWKTKIWRYINYEN